jgi:hypothetical protein
MQNDTIHQLTNKDLLQEVKALAARERRVTARLITILGELDVRRLYLAEGYSSLFTYCTQGLRLSEHAAYGRIEAARAARKFPRILDLLADGSITLTTVCLLAAHLTEENHQELLLRSIHKSKREVEQQIAALRPLPAVPSSIRKLPTPMPVLRAESSPGPAPIVQVDAACLTVSTEPVSSVPVPPPFAVVVPLAPERYKVQFTVTRDTHDRLRRVQDLLRHAVPDGDPAVIFDRALTLLERQLQRRKLGHARRPKPATESIVRSRHVPAHVRREVWTRDAGQCAFIGTDGRCPERGVLEFHHVVPFAAGGPTTVANVQLRCRGHNGLEAERFFGRHGPSVVRERAVPYRSGLGISQDCDPQCDASLGRRMSVEERPRPTSANWGADRFSSTS